jgi:hypothetical protein
MNTLNKLKAYIESVITTPNYASNPEVSYQIATYISKLSDIADLDILVSQFYASNRPAGQLLMRTARSVMALKEDIRHDQAKLITAIAIESNIPAMQTGLILKDVLMQSLKAHCIEGLEVKLMGRPCSIQEVSSLAALGNLMTGKQVHSFSDTDTGLMIWPIMWLGHVDELEKFNKTLHEEGHSHLNILAVKREVEAFSKNAGIQFKVLPFASWENIFSIVRTLELRSQLISHLDEVKKGATLSVQNTSVVLQASNSSILLQSFPEEAQEEIHKMLETIQQHTKALQPVLKVA